MNIKIENENENLFDLLFVSHNKEELLESMNRIRIRLKANGIKSLKGKKCLDVGCGGGRFCFVMAQMGAECYGIDVGEKSLKSAKKNAKMLKLKKQTNFHFANAYAIPFKNNEFDMIVSNGVAHHHTDMARAFKETYRLLKPGGKFFLYMAGESEYTRVRDRIRAENRIRLKDMNMFFKLLDVPSGMRDQLLDGIYAHYFYYSYKEIIQILKKIGFKDIKRQKSTKYDMKNDTRLIAIK